MSDLLVLCYHAVSQTWPAALSVTPDAFGRQLRMLERAGYTGSTFTRAVTERPAARTVVVTFDDAFRSVLELGAPILAELGWPGTVFAPSDHVSAGVPMVWPGIDHWAGTEHEDELRPLSWDELRLLNDSGWEVGSHTCTHPKLTEVEDAQLQRELSASRATIEEQLQTACPSLAYPYGDVDARVAGAAEAAGYDVAASLSPQWRARSRLNEPRVGVWHGEPLWRVAVKCAPPVRWVTVRS